MWFSIAVLIVACYLLGNLNGSVSISTLVAHEDVRSQGSGNAGLTNFIRNYGIGSGVRRKHRDFGGWFACGHDFTNKYAGYD